MNSSAMVAAAMLASSGLQAQGIAQRVAAAPDGTVRMSFAARPGICGDGRNISTPSSSDEWESDCDSGPVRVALTIRNHEVFAIRTYVGGHWRTSAQGATDLGQVSAPAAADYLLGLSGTLSGEGRSDPIFSASLADSAVIWPKLIAIARNQASPAATRKQAVFWLGQAAGEAATRGLDSIVYQSDLDRSVREQAVFALSQRPSNEGVPALLRVAKTHPDPAIRKKALFWLGQSGDPRAIALFQEILAK